MAIKKKEELLSTLKERIGDDTSDEALALIEDFEDTYSDLETRVSSAGDWKSKYEENDKQWRQKYRDRFFNSSNDDDDDDEDNTRHDNSAKPKTFSDLFKEV